MERVIYIIKSFIERTCENEQIHELIADKKKFTSDVFCKVLDIVFSKELRETRKTN